MRVPGRWVAQERFDAVPEEGGETLNLGVYVVAGRAAGLYVRRQRGPTDGSATSVGVLVRRRTA